MHVPGGRVLFRDVFFQSKFFITDVHSLTIGRTVPASNSRVFIDGLFVSLIYSFQVVGSNRSKHRIPRYICAKLGVFRKVRACKRLVFLSTNCVLLELAIRVCLYTSSQHFSYLLNHLRRGQPRSN